MSLSELFSVIIVPIITSVIGITGTIVVEIIRSKKSSSSGNLIVPTEYKSVNILNWRTILLIGGLFFVVPLLFVLMLQSNKPNPDNINSSPEIVLTEIFLEGQTATARSNAFNLLAQTSAAQTTATYESILATLISQEQSTALASAAQTEIASRKIATQEGFYHATETQNAIVRAIDIYNTAQAEVTKQAIVQEATQTAQVATAQAYSTKVPGFVPLFIDEFDDNDNGWAPASGNGYSVTIENGTLNISVERLSLLPFPWTCDKCGRFDSPYSIEVSIRTPIDSESVVAGLIFGAQTPLDTSIFPTSYVFSLNNSGTFYLEKISPLGTEPIRVWNRDDLIKPDGNFYTLRVDCSDKFISLYVDGKELEAGVKIDDVPTGYVGFLVQTHNSILIEYDNLIIAAP